MDNIKSLKLRWLHGQLLDVTSSSRVHFTCSPSSVWQPAINAYLCEGAIQICVELAGVDRSEMDLQIEPNRLKIRGQRLLPEPKECRPQQVLTMEIDYGPFARDIFLPVRVDIDNVTARQEAGMLWIILPLK